MIVNVDYIELCPIDPVFRDVKHGDWFEVLQQKGFSLLGVGCGPIPNRGTGGLCGRCHRTNRHNQTSCEPDVSHTCPATSIQGAAGNKSGTVLTPVARTRLSNAFHWDPLQEKT